MEDIRKTITLGKVAYSSKRKINEVILEIELINGNLSICGEIWNSKKTDIEAGGQCCEIISELFPKNKKVQRIIEVWKEWHLNDLHAGTPEQEAYLKEKGLLSSGKYDEVCQALKNVGLYEVKYNGKPYKYGQGWLRREIPQEIIKEIETW